MMGASVRDLITRLHAEAEAATQRTFLAPVLRGGRVRARIAGMEMSYRTVPATFQGWGRFQADPERRVARLQTPAEPWETLAYLDLLPALRVVLLWPADNDPATWSAVAYNASDARQRFPALGPGPFPVRLVDADDPGARRLERVLARVDGAVAWYGGIDVSADPARGDALRSAADTEGYRIFGIAGGEQTALLTYRLHAIEETERVAEARRVAEDGERAVRAEAALSTLEGRMRHALEKAGARLLSYTVSTPSFGQPSVRVEWRLGGARQTYTTLVSETLDVISSGVCLSHRDHDFDLTSLVGVLTAPTRPAWHRQDYDTDSDDSEE